MTLGDKIIHERKRRGWSQEALAEKLGVSRQAVSKWEVMQSMPETDKIVMMSKLFDVSTDYLLIDDKTLDVEKESKDFNEKYNNYEKIKLSDGDVNVFIEDSYDSSKMTGIGVFLCIISPILLIIFATSQGFFSLNSAFFIIVGVGALLLTIAFAVALFILGENKMKKYEHYGNEIIEINENTKTRLYEEMKEEESRNNIVTVGFIFLFIISPIPVIISAVAYNNLIGYGIAWLLISVGVGVYLAIISSSKIEAYEKLLQIKEYKVSKKLNKRKRQYISIYWSVVTLIYLFVNSVYGAWGNSWLIWIAALVLLKVFDLFEKEKKYKA